MLELMRVVGKVVSEPVFPETWSTMHLVQGRAFSAALRSTSKALIEGFLGQHFNPQVSEGARRHTETYRGILRYPEVS